MSDDKNHANNITIQTATAEFGVVDIQINATDRQLHCLLGMVTAYGLEGLAKELKMEVNKTKRKETVN